VISAIVTGNLKLTWYYSHAFAFKHYCYYYPRAMIASR